MWKKSAKALAVMYYLMQGTPYIYMGQELGITNTVFNSIDEYKDIAAKNDYSVMISRGFSKEEALRILNLTSRDNSRTPFPWNEDGGFSKAKPWIKYNQDIKTINVESEKEDPDSILNFYKKLISLRSSSDTLIYGSFKLLEEDDEDFFIYERVLDKEKYKVIVNMSEKKRYYPVKGDVVLSNYSDSKDEIRSWEAKVIKED